MHQHGVIATYAWNFGDGNTSIYSKIHPTHIQHAVGSYTVNLTVTGPGGSDFEYRFEFCK